MGFGVGVTFMTGNRAGKRSKTTKGGRPLGHQGDAGALLREMGEERWSATNNLDRSKSHLNIYGVGGLGRFRSGQEAYEYLCEQVTEYDLRAKEVAIAEGRKPPRAVNQNAPVLVASIFEPKAEYMATLTEEQQIRLLTDAAMAYVECGYIDDPDDVLISTINMDEGVPHLHVGAINRDPETGRIGTPRYNKPWKMDLLHRDLLDVLRAKGWDIAEHDVVDRERIKVDKEYKASRKRKRRQQGKSANVYAAEKEAAKARERAEAANREADAASARLDAILVAERSHVEAEREARESAEKASQELDAELQRQLAAQDAALHAKAEETAEALVEQLNAKLAELRKATADLKDKRSELREVSSDVDAKRVELADVTARLSDATAREAELAERESAVTAREDAAKAKERALDERDQTPRTVTVERDTPETRAEVKRLRAFRASAGTAYDKARKALAEEELVPMEAWGKPRIGEVIERLVEMVKTWAGRARTAERERDELALENARLRDELRAKSRDVSGSPGYVPDVDEGSGNEYGR